LKRRRWYHFALLAAALALTHLVHPFAFVVLVVPMVVMYAHAVRALSRLAHLGVAAAVGITIAANAYWLTTALEFWRYVRDVRVFCQGTALDLVTDLLGIVRDPAVTGRIGNLAGIRMLLLAAAILCLLGWRRRGDRRVAVFATAIGASLAFAYLGSYTWLLAQLQPYRFVVPAAFLTVVPAAALLIDDPERFTLQGLPRSRKWLLALLLLLAAARPAVEASSYFLEPLTARGFDFRHRPNQETFREVADWVSRADDGDGRFLVEWWPLGEYLAWKTDAQMLGGFPFRNLEHIAAHPLFRGHHGRKDGGDLERYLEQYAVKWIIVTRRRPGIENRHDLLERVGSQGGALGLRHRVYRVRTPSGLIAGNRGSARASLNRIEVTGTDPARDVVLRYHWLETLVCREGCTVEREPIEDDPVGFIRVPAPHPPDFEIVNGY